jgi:hypothetical protein
MHLNIESLVSSTLHAARSRELERRAELARLLPAPSTRRIRRNLGRSIVRLGARIAADPSLEPTRS